jgi:acetyl esterase
MWAEEVAVMVHPAFEPYIRLARENAEPSPSTESAEERRRAFRSEAEAIRGELSPMATVEERGIDLDGRTLEARLYVPSEEEALALIVYFHGGSFVMGDLDTHDWVCRRLAFDTGVRLLSINYRLAPEHPFPAALDDATDVVRYVAEHRQDFAAADAAIIMMGDSAGANLVTVAARQLRDAQVEVAAQVLIYPTLGPELVTDSAHRFGSGYLLDLESLRHDYSIYLDGFVDHTDPRVTPLLCNDLSGVAPAVVVVAQCDPLRDEGVAYAGLLGHFGVPVELLEAKEMVHGFLEMGGVVPDALEILDDLASHLHRLVGAAS